MHFFKNLLFLCFILSSFPLSGQITGASFRGLVVDGGDGSPIIGASVTLEHLPTATKYRQQTDESGQFGFPEVRAGGPYCLRIQSLGLNPYEKCDLSLALGSVTNERIALQSAAVGLAEIEIRYDRNADKQGASSHFTKSTIEKLPTISNGIQDVTRLSPNANGNSFGGSNYRYNNLTIDGAANNDAFGFVEPAVGAGGSQASGTPGSLARAQPISLDAIGELQVAVAPFDVSLGNFTGGAINAVTRSGTNQTQRTIYNFTKNQNITGRSADENRTPIAGFWDYLSGASIGGAIRKDTLFYFANIEHNQRLEPAAFAGGSAGSNFGTADLQRIKDTIQRRYGYDVGTFGNRNLATQNLKLFARLDWNATATDQISIRHNYVDARAEYLTRSANIFNFESQGFTHFSNTNSTVLEWRSQRSARWFNKVIASHSYIDEHRQTFGNPFPHIEITNGSAGNIFAGQYREAVIFRTRQRTVELTDNLQYFIQQHRFTFGTHNEIYGINYHFVTPWNGRWAYSSIDNFLQNKPSRVRQTFNLLDNSYDFNSQNPSARYQVILSALYAQDEISLFDQRLTLTLGVRLDGALFPTRPKANADVLADPNFAGFSEQLSNKYVIAPRLGFNYKHKNAVFRGGSGVFVGRMPFAWFTYPFLYDGNHYGNIDYRPAGRVVPLESSTQDLTNLQGNFQREINLLDPKLRLPQVWRNNLAVDYKLGRGWQFTLEGIYTKTLQDVKFETRNLKNNFTTLAYDGRPYFSGEKVNPAFTSVFVVTNTSAGFRYNLSAQIAKSAENWHISAAYTFGESKDLANGVRVSPQANWEWNQTIHPNQPALSYANFDTRHRAIVVGDWTLNAQKKYPTTFSLIFSANSGVPFSFVYNGDANRDGSPTNDLIFVPRNQAESGLVDIKNAAGQVTLSAAQQWDNLNRYIDQNAYLRTRRGMVAERNGARTPWNRQLDLRILQEFRWKSTKKIQISLDLINFTNLLSPTWGRQYFVPNTTNAGYALLTLLKVEGNLPQYRFDAQTGDPFQFDPNSSRMQGQLGIKFNF